ncbi:putative amp dependent CoA ligase [Xylaria digitata]|nr:putative amp dependent CoA ligase [Xylaria digitata]
MAVMWYYIILATFVLLRVTSYFVGSSKKGPVHDQRTVRESDVAGDPWEYLSIFEHIEQGLKKNPYAPAVISTFQSADHLQKLFCSIEDIHQIKTQCQPQNGLWQKLRQQGDIRQNEMRDPAGETEAPVGETRCLSLSYLQLHQAALNVALGLRSLGAQPNTTLLMLIPNGVEYAILLWACTLLHVTYVSLDPSCLDISGFTNLKYTLRELKPQIVVVPDAASGRSVDVCILELSLPQPIRACLSDPPRSSSARWKTFASIAKHATLSEGTDADAMVAAARCDDPRRIHSIMFTSGTSGRPKGCPMRVVGMSHVLQSQSWLVSTESGGMALQQPHNSRGIAPAQTLQTWKAGGAVVMTGQNFNVAKAAEAVRARGATFLVLTPPMVHEMAAELAERPLAGMGLSSVHTVQVGGDAVTRDILIKCAALFPHARVCINHGMTEGAGSFVWPFSRVPPQEIPFFGEIAPVGKVAPGTRVRIWNFKKNRAAERGELGELHVSSPSLIGGYMASRSSESFYKDAEGRNWFITGDIATANADGLVYILGRRSSMIDRAGTIVMPAVIESSIEAYTGVQAVVVSIPHHVLGAEPFAVISSFPAGKTEMQIKEHVCRALDKDYALAGLASLKQLGFVDFPINQTHKVIRSEIRQAVLKYMSK